MDSWLSNGYSIRNERHVFTGRRLPMKTVDLSYLREARYTLKRVIAHMHYRRAGSNWIIQEGGRSNSAVMALLSVGADYLDVDTHEIIASACPGDLVYTPQNARYEFHVRSASDSIANISNLPNGSFYWDGVKHDAISDAQVANAIFLGFEMQTEEDEPLVLSDRIEVLRFKEAKRFFKQIEHIARMSGNGFAAPALITAKAYEFLTDLSETSFSKRPRTTGYRKIEPALQYIAGQPVGTISVAELSHMCGMSVSGFRKVFHQEMNQSPAQYIQEQTLKRAMCLLSTSDLSISEIAYECGFKDAFYFSRFFRKMTDLPPTQWRSAGMNGIQHE